MRENLPLRTAALALLLWAPSCFDRGDRWFDPPPPAPECTEGATRCGSALERCDATPTGNQWLVVQNCEADGLVCAESLGKCTECIPARGACDGQSTLLCKADGSGYDVTGECDPTVKLVCREGGCVDLCNLAEQQKSNVGCEYWAVDLDNAMIDATSNAAAQQFAVAISNPQPDVAVTIRIFDDDTAPGTPGNPQEIARATIAPNNLEVFKLGPREVDGSPHGEFNTGTHTALTRSAYRVQADFPVVAYQFNPLENVAVFSNDASLLYPREALSYSTGSSLSYVVLGWPQTIAITDDPNTNFDPSNPINLRSTLTIVGTRDATTVRVRPKTVIVGDGGALAETGPGESLEVLIDAYDVLNLETGDFLADFTGTTIESDEPIAVFSGSEAADAPHFTTLSNRRCCADHLEDQLPPIRTAGTRFAVPHTPSRTRAVGAAGATLAEVPEPDYVRFLATTMGGAEIVTTLPPPNDRFVLAERGDFFEVEVTRDFVAESSAPVLVAQIMASQDAAGVKRGLPGGDPSLMMVPPLEQARSEYVFLTPDKYAFDFVTIVAGRGVPVYLDAQLLDDKLCEIAPADGLTVAERGGEPDNLVYRCQLSFPLIDPSTDPATVLPGQQNDGVHRIVAGAPAFVVVTGFDAFVSYAYAAGTDLRDIAPPE